MRRRQGKVRRNRLRLLQNIPLSRLLQHGFYLAVVEDWHASFGLFPLVVAGVLAGAWAVISAVVEVEEELL